MQESTNYMLAEAMPRCTTCRVEFLDGEPDRMTVAECGDVLVVPRLNGSPPVARLFAIGT